MDTVQRSQDIIVKPIEETATNTSLKERKVRSHKEQALNCPRCNSTNTKFCYYNNYSLSQPRYFCKTCRRYWTEGGSVRNIPVGGGSRKNKRSSSNPISTKNLEQNPNTIQDKAQDLNLGFPTTSDFKTITDPITSTSRGLMNLSSFMSMPIIDPNTVYSSGFSLPEFRPSLSFSLDGLGSNYGDFQGVHAENGKLLFPYQDLNKQVPTNIEDADEQNRSDQIGDSSGYWNGMIGGGTW